VTAVGYCPIGVDADRVMHDRDRAGVNPKIQALRALYKDKKIIVGREKLDVAKGVYNKLQAFEKFLETYPEWRGKVILIQVTTPALSESPNLETKVAELVSHINNQYGTLDFVPVHHFHQAIDRDEYFGLLSAADLGLITSLRDGMNTTSMEYVLCQDKTSKSPLVLSEFMGTASSFQAALQINPHDLLGVARAIHKGLTMPQEEKEKRHDLMLESVKSHTSHTWARTLLKQLLENVGLEHQAHQTPALDRNALAAAYKASKKRLLLFDYDGTLTPIVKVPSQAIPTPRTKAAIAALAKDPKNVVWLISGRDGEFLDEHWGDIPNLGLSAEHGSFVKGPGAHEWINMTEHMDMSWMGEVEEIFRYYTEVRDLRMWW
jgi:trehalose 6-phosphate synthase/phosphatase